MNLKLNVFVVAVAVASAIASPSVVLACSIEPIDIIEVSKSADENGVVILDRGSTFSSATLEQNGAEILGSVETGSNGVIIFRPDEPLQPGEYQLNISAWDTITATVVVPETPTAEFSINVLSMETERGWEGVDCCSTPIIDSCSGGSACWPTQYNYTPNVEIQIDSDSALIFDVVMEHQGSESQNTLLSRTDGRVLSHPLELSDDDLCIKVTARNLAGEQVGVKEECLSPSEFPEPQREKPPEADTDECTEDPRTESPPNPDLPNPIHRSTRGCSTTSPTNGALPLLLALLFGLGRRRNALR